jgi:RHS repeat-associated protein
MDRVASLTFGDNNHSGEDATYGYHASGQMTTTLRGTTALNEAYTYDANGNRVTASDTNTVGVSDTNTASVTTGPNNQLLFDGTYDYTYDNEGNRATRVLMGTLYDDEGNAYEGAVETTVYSYDYRNRLTDVKVYAGDVDPSNLSKHFIYTYDVYNRRITTSVNNGLTTGGLTVVTQNVYDQNDNIILQMDGAENLTNRYLYGPQPNQILADEQIGGTTNGQVLWALADNLGTVRDLVRLMPGTSGDTLTIANHLVYDSFGNVISETREIVGDMNADGALNDFDISLFELALTHPATYEAEYPQVTDWVQRGDANGDGVFNNYDIDPFANDLTSGKLTYVGHSFLIGFAGMVRDDETGLLQDHARYYDPKNGVFLTQDPAQDGMNWYDYARNSPTNFVDPSGTTIVVPCDSKDTVDQYLVGQGFESDSLAVPFGYMSHPAGKGLTKFISSFTGQLLTTAVQNWGGNLDKEIIGGLLHAGRTFTFVGGSPAKTLDKIKMHIAERDSIVSTVTASKIQFGVGDDEKWNSEFWDADENAKGPASAAVLNAVGGTYSYVMGCFDGIVLNMLGGILKAHAGDTEYIDSFNKQVGNDPIGEAWDFLDVHSNVPWFSWIPGDRGWIENKDEASSETAGYEGHNMIYLGAGMFSGAYGAGGGGAQTLNQALTDVWRWQGNGAPSSSQIVMMRSWIADTRRFPPIR